MEDFFESYRFFGKPKTGNPIIIRFFTYTYWPLMIIMILLLTCATPAHSQTKPITKENGLSIDSTVILQAEWSKYADSLVNHTTIFQFKSWLEENATVKQYSEGKFVDFYNSFLQYKQQLWLQSKKKK